ncbi:MAG: branched-chain amino acid ABC transporter ATP-binding protein/permease [Casimicrobiaceae bacterium]
MTRVYATMLIVGGVLATFPLLGLPLFYESFLYLVFHWIVLATSWNILSGYSGYFSFGHGAFFGAGMYTTATLASRFDVPFLWTLPAAAIVAILMGVALGAVVFRVRGVRGELFALVTLAFTFVVGTIVLNTPIDGGPGVYLSAVPVPKVGPSPASTFYLMGLAAALGTLAIAYGIYRSRLGIGLFAIHDDEDVAEVLGVPTFQCKMAAFAVSCGLAGIAGGMHALFVSYVTAGDTFTITVPLTVVLMSVLGGTRQWAGPAVGATIITALLYAFTAGNLAVAGKAVFGAVLIVVILFMPQGVLGGLIARRRRKVHVPVIPAVMGDAATAAEIVPRRTAVDADRILVARGIRKAFRGVRALDGVDIDVRAGEILGLLGPNGSGKSTFINLVSGHYRPDGGTLVLGGEDILHCSAHRIARAGVARTYQIPRPFEHLTVIDNAAVPAMFGAAHLDRRAALREARRWLEFTDLGDKADWLPEDLNLHQRKFLELARALASRPRLLLLDEVLSGLTPAEIDGAIGLIRRIRDDGATIVFVEHVMRAVWALTDRIVVLDHGQVIAEGAADDVMRRSDVVTAFLGKAHA